jgi:hypothetical protein
MKHHLRRLLAGACIVSLSCLCSCSDPDREFQRAKEANTEAGYALFIKKFPDSPHVPEAEKAIESLAFAAANKEGAKPAFQAFTNRFPHSPLNPLVSSNLLKLDFNEAVAANSAAKWEAFINTHPGSSYAVQAAQLWARLKYEEIKNTNDVDVLRKFSAVVHGTDSENSGLARIVRIFADRLIEKESLSDKQTVEDEIIADIKAHGTAGRLVFPDLPPERNSTVGSLAVEGLPNTPGMVSMKILYPKDSLQFGDSVGGMTPQSPFGPGSIWRFIGTVEVFGYNFTGQRSDPLTFMVLEGGGFAYLHGSGRISGKGITADLPPKP